MIQRPNIKRRLFILLFGLVAVSATAYAGVASGAHRLCAARQG
jgi:hypothetical protein